MIKFVKRGNERSNDVLSGGEEPASGRRKASRRGAVVLAVALFLVAFAVVVGATYPFRSAFTVGAGVLVGLGLAGSVHIAYEWERAVVLRFGRFHRLAGPGLYVTIPVVDSVTIVIDQRISSISCSAEQVLTADLVPVDVDAILFWMVWDAEKACLEVENYPKAVLWSAQTAMRDAIGQLNLADLSLRRKQIDRELQEIMGAKCEQWGITVMSVEIRDIMVPRELQDALSKEAQAERERNARVILAEVEKDISEMFVEAAEVYDRNPKAMQLRAMNLAYEGAKDGKGVLLAPSSLADGFDVSKLFNGE